MRITCLLALLVLLPKPSGADILTVDAVAGGDLMMAVGVGYGNWLTSSIWNDGILPTDDRRLESFSIMVTPPPDAEPLTYRMAVGVLDQGHWRGDVYSTEATLEAGAREVTAQIPGGLMLDPSVNYMAYIVPDDPGWMYQTTLNNQGPGVVGVSILFYTTSDIVDLDLPYDRDVAMHATFSTVPEPGTLALLGIGIVGFVVRHSRSSSTLGSRSVNGFAHVLQKCVGAKTTLP